ncbi:MAG: hypothetical protein HY534_01305, partial [Chloroflexi bacterium]|nr:hypothetical protein [Chloroflexota bacterium]
RVAAVGRFVPGQTTTVSAAGISVTLPSNFHTEQLDFELLLGNAADWQPCVGSDRVVVAPYAYRVRETATGRAVGRFDNPVQAAITDPRIDSSSTYWITTAESPPTVEPSSNPHAIEGTTYVTENPAARRGWFLTVPRR